MPKTGGLGDNLYIAGYNFSGDIGSLSAIRGGPVALDVTGIDKGAMERIGGLRDGGIDFDTFWNVDPDHAHEVLATLPTADVVLSYCRGTVLGAAGACLVGKQINYDPSRGSDGALTCKVTAEGNGFGLEWGKQLTAGQRTDTTATSGVGVDFGLGSAPDLDGSADFGLQAYLQVFDVTGTSVTVKLQESSDNGVGDTWADVVGGAFVAATGPGAQRIQTARGLTVERYLRAVTTGTFTEAIFAVTAVRNDTETVF